MAPLALQMLVNLETLVEEKDTITHLFLRRCWDAYIFEQRVGFTGNSKVTVVSFPLNQVSQPFNVNDRLKSEKRCSDVKQDFI